jgi:hypothetical protein
LGLRVWDWRNEIVGVEGIRLYFHKFGHAQRMKFTVRGSWDWMRHRINVHEARLSLFWQYRLIAIESVVASFIITRV